MAGILDVKSSMEYKAVAGNDKADDNMAVEFNHVTFTYEGAGASSLSDITFRAKKGQTIGIIGGTGSGKSTLIKAAMGLLGSDGIVTRGGYLLYGTEYSGYSGKEKENPGAKSV